MSASQPGQWCYRGQGDCSWPLKPSLERLVVNRRLEDAARLERVFLARFQRQAHHYLPTTPGDTEVLEWLALMQHWGVPTRLLDFTLSPYVALYFAVTDPGKDGSSPAVWAVRYTWLQSIASDELHGKTIAEILPDHRAGEPLRFHRLFDGTFRQRRKDLMFVAPVQPFLMNERLAVQQGIFLCPFSVSLPFEAVLVQPSGFQKVAVTTDKEEVSGDFARKFVITPSLRAEILRQLHRANISAASLFPGLEGFARSLREAYDALSDVQSPLMKDFELGAIEDVGWSG